MMNSRIPSKGFSLIEVAVTLAITAVGLLGLSSLQLQSMRATQDTGSRSQAIWMANELVNRMRANENGLLSYVTTGAESCSDLSSGVKRCSAYNNGSVRVPAAADCNAQEMAEFDMFDVMCGSISDADGIVQYRTGSAFSLSEPRLQITNVNTLDKSLTISWNVQTYGEDSSGQKRFTNDDTSIASTRGSYVLERFRP
jgi:type IV pilus assembly protein PilV